MRRRVLLVTVGLPLYVAALVVSLTALLGLISEPPFLERDLADWLRSYCDMLGDWDWVASCGLFALAFAASQIVFLLPAIRMRPPMGERARSLALSLVLGAAIASFLLVGMAAGALELGASLVTGIYAETPWGEHEDLGNIEWLMVVLLMMLLASWGVWSFVLLVYTRQLWADKILARLVRFLLAGTVFEILIMVPIDIMVRRRTDCYCSTGSFAALSIAATAGIWLAGPGVYFLLTTKQRRLFRKGYCGRCGYHRGPTPGEKCPECGLEWGRSKGEAS